MPAFLTVQYLFCVDFRALNPMADDRGHLSHQTLDK